MRAQVAGLRTAAVAVAGVVVLGVAAVLAAHQPPPSAQPVRPVTDVAGAGGGAGATASGNGSLPWWLPVVAIVLLVFVVTLLWFVFRDGLLTGGEERREATDGRRDDEHARRVAELAALAEAALTDAALDLDAGVEPREVVIACWVRIEHAADAAGHGRRPAETATDVARRWLAGRPDRAAVDDLAALYHLARYSEHPMTGEHRDRARAALRGALGVTA